MWNSQDDIERIIILLFKLAFVLIFIAYSAKIAIEESYRYKIHVSFNNYYCNAYELEDSRLVLKDCSKEEEIIIYNPTDFRVRE